jgi:hypothetical protein
MLITREDVARVANRFRKQAATTYFDIMQQIAKSIEAVQQETAKLGTIAQTMTDLINAADPGRRGRVGDLRVKTMVWNGSAVTAEVMGKTGDYQARITVFPRRGFMCTCPDAMQRARQVGPCKHTVRLAMEFRDDRVLPAMETIAERQADVANYADL